MIYYDKLVSVIMPMHNSVRFMEEAIDSVIAQTYTNWELLIIDDASTDDSPLIAKRYADKDSRIKYLVNHNHIGMPSAPRNVGIKAAKGEFIAFLDSDDIWYPTKLSEQLQLFSEDNVAIVYSNYEKINERGEKNNRIVTAPARATYHSLLHGNVIGNLTGMYDRRKVGKIDFKDIHHEDYAMWLSILKKGYIAKNTRTTTAAYRVLDNSVSSNKLRVLPWQWMIYRKTEKLPFIHSCYYFANYAIRALIKSFI